MTEVKELIKEVIDGIIDSQKARVEEMKAILVEMYPQDNWDISVNNAIHDIILDVVQDEGLESPSKKEVEAIIHEYRSIDFFRVVLKFSDFYITNNRKERHHMLEFYMVIDFNCKMEMLRVSGLKGDRTLIEHLSGYGHSHMSGGTFGTPGSLCFGSGPINTTISYMRSEFTLDHFRLLLMHINNYVKWESLEGIPYRKIRNITANTLLRSVSLWRLSDIWRSLQSFLFNYITTGMIYPYIENGHVKIGYTEAFEELLGDILYYQSPKYPFDMNKMDLVGIKGENGKLYQLSIQSRNFDPITTNVYFKGQPIVCNVKNIPIALNANYKYYANKDVTEYICGKIESFIQDKLFRSSLNRTFSDSQDEDFYYVTTANDLAVQQDS